MSTKIFLDFFFLLQQRKKWMRIELILAKEKKHKMFSHFLIEIERVERNCSIVM